MFGTKPITTETIKAKADAALSLFRTAVKNLQDSSDESVSLQQANQATIDDLELNNRQLETLVDDNEKVITNINNLINS